MHEAGISGRSVTAVSIECRWAIEQGQNSDVGKVL